MQLCVGWRHQGGGWGFGITSRKRGWSAETLMVPSFRVCPLGSERSPPLALIIAHRRSGGLDTQRRKRPPERCDTSAYKRGAGESGARPSSPFVSALLAR
eukprot:scaffold47845_cov37-Tisochrysis_lutea.AAC.1